MLALIGEIYELITNIYSPLVIALAYYFDSRGHSSLRTSHVIQPAITRNHGVEWGRGDHHDCTGNGNTETDNATR